MMPVRSAGAKMTVLGLQHLFAMFGATVLVPVITGLSVSSTLLFAGLGTLLFHLLTKMKRFRPSWAPPSLSSADMRPVRSVGVMGDERTYENPVALRAVVSTDAMTADWFPFPYDFLRDVSNEIIRKVKGVNRVVYDISSKPPATIEWE